MFQDLNGNGISDPGEPGVAGIKLEMDGSRRTTTDRDGRYEFTGDRGTHHVTVVATELGTRLLATTSTEQSISIGGLERLDLNFGVRDQGAIRGRVFNDVPRDAAMGTSDDLGLKGVRVILRSVEANSGGLEMERFTDGGGSYAFSDLRPGRYVVSIDPGSLPPNFQIPDIAESAVTVSALGTSSVDIPVAAQRAVSGVVYVDTDRNGAYDPAVDFPVPGAAVALNGGGPMTTDETGRYLLRNLPAGRSMIVVRPPIGAPEMAFEIEFAPAPETRRSVDIAINSSSKSGGVRFIKNI